MAKTRWWFLGLRVTLGIIFAVAGASKLAAQSQFINEVAGYGLLSSALARVYAFTLPWVELFVGCSLVLGVFSNLTLVLSVLMTLSFIIANVYATRQGLGEGCGCFGQLIPLSHSASLGVDVLMIFTAALLLFYRSKITVQSIDALLSRSVFAKPAMPKYLADKAVPVILVFATVLAIGLPSVPRSTTSEIYSKIDTPLAQGKSVFLFFYSEGCGECEKQKPIIDDLEEQYQGKVSFIPVDYKVESRVAADFEVAGVPAMLLIGSKNDNGYTVLKRFLHLTSKEILQDSFYKTLGISVNYYGGGLKADFSATPSTGVIPVNVQFTDLSKGEIESWAWDFDNDGIVDSVLQYPGHTYSKSGTYTVSLTVSSPSGSYSETKSGYLQFAPGDCQADFLAEPTSVSGIKPIRFVDLSKGEIISWEWDFNGDGVVDSIERNPTHTYTSDGIYTVSLTIKTPDRTAVVTKPSYIKISGCG